mgnify:CR=1 FL=1
MNVEAVAALMIMRGQQVPVDMIIRLQEMGHNFDAFEKMHTKNDRYTNNLNDETTKDK